MMIAARKAVGLQLWLCFQVKGSQGSDLETYYAHLGYAIFCKARTQLAHVSGLLRCID